MFNFLAVVHIIASFVMVAFILLQDPKGGGAFGLMGGGGSKSLFGSSGANHFLVSVTKWMAIVFAFTSIYLAALSAEKNTSIIDQYTSAPEATGKVDSSKGADSTSAKDAATDTDSNGNAPSSDE